MSSGRSVAPGNVAAVLLVVATCALFAPGVQPSDPSLDDPDLYPEEILAARAAAGAETWERIWYRKDSQSHLKPYTDSGDLALFDDAIEFLDRKHGWRIPFDRIERVELGRMRGDQEVDWILLRLREDDPSLEVALRDGGAFGFGHRTREIHRRIEDRLRAADAAQWNLPAGVARFEGLEHQLSFTYPSSWNVRATATEYRGGVDSVGTLHLGVEGRSGIQVHRREDSHRKRCSGLGADTLEDLRREIAESEAFLGGAITSEDLDESPTEVGGCAGVRFRAGARGRLLDLRAVSYRGTLFLFSVVAPEEEMTELVSALERLAASVTFPVLRWEPAR